jgi:hypothetical protein
MTTVLSSTTFDPSIKEEISSWIQNEQQCVTAHRIAQTHSISRAEASRLLQEIVQDSPKHFPWQITMVVQERKQQQHKSSSNTDNLTTNKTGMYFSFMNDILIPFLHSFCLLAYLTSVCSIFDSFTVFRLATSTKMPDSIDDGTTVFAVAPAPGRDNDHSPEQVSTAHERDMVTLREMVQEGRYSLTTMFPSSNKKRSVASISTIDPAEGLLEWLDHKANAVTAGKSHEEVQEENEVEFALTKFVGRSSRPVGKKTTTTAASFFSAHNKKATNPTNNHSSNGGTSHEKEAPVAKATGTTTSNHKTSGKSSSTSSSAPTASTSGNKSLSQSSSMTTSSKPNPDRQEKENKINSRPSYAKSNTTSAKVGNADDFVGDLDEDEDDDDEDIEIVPPPLTKVAAATTKKQPPQDDTIDIDNPANDRSNDDNDEEDDPPEKEGSKSTNTNRSTTFIPTNFNDPNRKRKRRKKLIEKTTMQNGYLHTETQSIWEDVPTDEEQEEEKAAIARQRAIPQQYENKNTVARGGSTANTKTSGGAKATTSKNNNKKNDSMKQKSLMGFFAKK